MCKEFRYSILHLLAVFSLILLILSACDLLQDPPSDRQKTLGEWMYNRVVYIDGSFQTYNGNIITITSSGGSVTVYTNSSYTAVVFNEKNSCLWETCNTNGNIITNTGTWSIKETDKLLTLTKVNYTNILFIFTNVYFVYNYAYTYDFIDDNTIKITAEIDSYNCIFENNTPTNYSTNNIDIFAAAGVNYVEIGKIR